jgi:hypothetical protein
MTAKLTPTEKTCVVCGGTFVGRRQAKTCSPRCRQEAYRWRQFWRGFCVATASDYMLRRYMDLRAAGLPVPKL